MAFRNALTKDVPIKLFPLEPVAGNDTKVEFTKNIIQTRYHDMTAASLDSSNYHSLVNTGTVCRNYFSLSIYR